MKNNISCHNAVWRQILKTWCRPWWKKPNQWEVILWIKEKEKLDEPILSKILDDQFFTNSLLFPYWNKQLSWHFQDQCNTWRTMRQDYFWEYEILIKLRKVLYWKIEKRKNEQKWGKWKIEEKVGKWKNKWNKNIKNEKSANEQHEQNTKGETTLHVEKYDWNLITDTSLVLDQIDLIKKLHEEMRLKPRKAKELFINLLSKRDWKVQYGAYQTSITINNMVANFSNKEINDLKNWKASLETCEKLEYVLLIIDSQLIPVYKFERLSFLHCVQLREIVCEEIVYMKHGMVEFLTKCDFFVFYNRVIYK